MSRRMDLLAKVAEAFADGQEVSHDFLVEHAVTADECFDMLNDVARAIRVYLALPKDERLVHDVQDAARQAMPGRDGERLGQFVAEGLRMNTLTRMREDAVERVVNLTRAWADASWSSREERQRQTQEFGLAVRAAIFAYDEYVGSLTAAQP